MVTYVGTINGMTLTLFFIFLFYVSRLKDCQMCSNWVNTLQEEYLPSFPLTLISKLCPAEPDEAFEQVQHL